MKKTALTFIILSGLLTSSTLKTQAQHAATKPAQASNTALVQPEIADQTAQELNGKPVQQADEISLKPLQPASMKSYAEFRKSVRPLIEQMGLKKIIGLGEGTHGTAEFYQLRYWITRILVEEKGFRHIAFENDQSDSWFLNRELAGTKDLNGLMKKYLLSIWQNEEVKELLTWAKAYNQHHAEKVVIEGLDYVMLATDVNMLQTVLGPAASNNLNVQLSKLMKAASFQDYAWEAMNKKVEQIPMDSLFKSGYAAYLVAADLEKKISAMPITESTKQNSLLALNNLKQGFGVFYAAMTKTTEISRDSCMAYNASLLLKTKSDKMVIWAHNAHVAKTAIYNGEAGGTGGHLLRMYPNNYFVLGTGTATGTFAATVEPRDTYTNPMLPYQLEAPIAGSWEEIFNGSELPAFYFDPALLNPHKVVKPLRFVGYTPKSGPSSYEKTAISDLFDAYIFIKETHAGTALKLPVAP